VRDSLEILAVLERSIAQRLVLIILGLSDVLGVLARFSLLLALVPLGVRLSNDVGGRGDWCCALSATCGPTCGARARLGELKLVC